VLSELNDIMGRSKHDNLISSNFIATLIAKLRSVCDVYSKSKVIEIFF
jgi:hypothetical protein